MSEHKHTPRPWKWVGDTLATADGQAEILSAEDMPENEYPEDQSAALIMPNEEGDRPLIEAAPDMLEALEGAIEELKYYGPQVPHYGACGGPNCKCDALCAEAIAFERRVCNYKAAIKKAKGEA